MSPLFTVVIPTYNRWPLVRDAIDSVLKQSFPNYEIIVVDDGSTDETCSQVEMLYGDKVQVIRQRNSGVSCARNVGVSAAKGRFIAYLDSDDLWVPEKLEEVAGVLQRYDGASFVFSDFKRYFMDPDEFAAETNTQLFPRIFDDMLRTADASLYIADSDAAVRCVVKDYPFFPSTFIVSRAVHDHLRWDPAVRYSEDFNFVARLAERHPMLYLDRPLVTVRMHGANKSANRGAKLESHMRTLGAMEFRVAGNRAQNEAVRAALGRRHMTAARTYARSKNFGRAFGHCLSALTYPEWYGGALRRQVRHYVANSSRQRSADSSLLGR